MITISIDSKFVLTWYFQHVQSDPPTAKSLAQLISQMIQFQEDCLGKGAKNPPFPRLPVSFIFIPTYMPDRQKCHDIFTLAYLPTSTKTNLKMVSFSKKNWKYLYNILMTVSW